MKILEVLNKIAQQRQLLENASKDEAAKNASKDEAVKNAENQIHGKVREIYSAKEAKESWAAAAQNNSCKEYFDSIINLLAQMSVLSVEELEANYDIKKLTHMKFLVHNTNKRLALAMGGLSNTSGPDISNKNKNKDLFELIRTYLEYTRPEAVEEFINFYKKDNNVKLDAIEGAIKESMGQINNFSSWLSTQTNNTLTQQTILDLAELTTTRGSINMGKYELALAILLEKGSCNSGQKGDVVANGVGIEIKASANNAGFGKIGGQQGSFINSDTAIISTVQSAVKEFASASIELLNKAYAKSDDVQKIKSTYIDSDLQYAVDRNKFKLKQENQSGSEITQENKKWKAVTIDKAIIEIIKEVHRLNNIDPSTSNASLNVKIMDLAKTALKKIWSAWNTSDDAIKLIHKLVDVYFNNSIEDILNGVNKQAFYRSRKGKQILDGEIEVLFKDFDKFTKAVGFVLLKKYASLEGFDFIYLINMSADSCFILKTKFIDTILEYLLRGSDVPTPDTDEFLEDDENAVNKILKAIEITGFSLPQTYGNASRGAQWGTGSN